MERYARDIENGNYSPTFFTIRIPNEENYENLLANEKMSEQAEAYFLHEYIHFLQDLTTIPGLSNIGIVVDYMKWATHQGKDGKLMVPAIPTQQDGFHLWDNQEMNESRLGQGALKDIVVKKVKSLVLNDKIVSANGDRHTHLNARVTFEDTKDIESSYLIGEFAISESMAYTIEQIIYPNVLPKGYDCPYSIVRLVCDKFLPGLSDDPVKIIALCDACLLFSFPGRVFAMAVDMLKTVDYMKQSAEQVFERVTQNPEILAAEHNKLQKVSINDHLEQYSVLAAEQLSGYFTTCNYDTEKMYSVLMLNMAIEIRKQHPYFFLDIARGGVLRDNNILKRILGEIGCPVILNKTEALTTIYGRISVLAAQSKGKSYDPSCFWVFNQMYKMFKHGCQENDTFKCEMIDWCKKSFAEKKVKDLTAEGDNCLYSPWLRMSDEEFQFCTFGRFWRTIKLSGISPVNKKKT